jgi:hypothetical protein
LAAVALVVIPAQVETTLTKPTLLIFGLKVGTAAETWLIS